MKEKPNCAFCERPMTKGDLFYECKFGQPVLKIHPDYKVSAKFFEKNLDEKPDIIKS